METTDLTTKILQNIREDITELEAKLDGKIDELEAKLDGKIDKLEAKLGGRIDKLDGRIDKLEAKLDSEIAAVRGDMQKLATGDEFPDEGQGGVDMAGERETENERLGHGRFEDTPGGWGARLRESAGRF